MKKISLKKMALYMNPRHIDLSSHSPLLMPAVQNNPNDGFLIVKFPDIPSQNIIIGGNDTVIAGDVTMGRGNAIMENCHIRGDGKPITIGNHNDFQNGVVVHVSRTRNAASRFGNYNSLTHGVTWHGAVAEDLCFIAFDSTINDGAYLETGCFVNTNSNIEANTHLQAGMQYDGRITSGDQHNNKRAKEILLVNVVTQESRELGDITGKYAKGQIRSTQSRRLIRAEQLGERDLATGVVIPAQGYIEHICLQTGSYYLRTSASMLFTIAESGVSLSEAEKYRTLAKEALLLDRALAVIFRGQKETPEISRIWDRRSDIVGEIKASLEHISELIDGDKPNLDIPQKFTGMNDPIRMNKDDILKSAEKLAEFEKDISRSEHLAAKPRATRIEL